ncbi:MAG TPA: NADH-quinone oxidoreductase subunit NuoG [Steroidobacteraceae bacterium]|jgi:NADH-quinone oxidoreductase subunit G|nr:NADH-quinone oxidoreductase subunit NuoG [Steroidobacteraceae bacterium]
MAEEFVNIEVNGVPVKARKGEMIIRATDANGVYVPRFCYHDKLSIAANCRMCLVEVEKAPKPLPACATPVAEGMKIFTQSQKATGAQRATMEFLLINHPLDCPICDQGGECELQDLAVGFGRDISRFAERKRVVKDESLGPLVSTDMTRCIQCTRCIRFTQEIAGVQELGMVGRGEDSSVRAFVERTVDHELSGNIIDLCPVGALNSKPFRFSARAWEMIAHPLVSPHDGVGTNLFGHVLRGKLMRVVPRDNETINETWIADRDRFSYEGVYSADRIGAPLLRERGSWSQVSWESALAVAVDGLRRHAASLGALSSASATTEELYLLNRLTRGLGSPNLDHRLRGRDFSDQAADAPYPNLGMQIAAVDQLNGLLVIGANLRREVPVLAHRVRKASLAGAAIAFVNPATFDYKFKVAAYLKSAPAAQVSDLAAVLAALAAQAGAAIPAHLAGIAAGASVTQAHQAIATALLSGPKRAVWLGALALRHPQYADLRALAGAIAQLAGATLGELAEGGNGAGAYLAGCVPHREAGGKALAAVGKSAAQMLQAPLAAYILFGGVEPEADTLSPEALKVLAGAELVVAITPYMTEQLKQIAHVVLPIGTFAETSGTYVNLEGLWQSFTAAARGYGESRPGWKVLRVLGTELGIERFEYQTSEEVRDELRRICADGLPPPWTGSRTVSGSKAAATTVDVPMYQVDAVVRRAPSLQRTAEGRSAPAVY